MNDHQRTPSFEEPFPSSSVFSFERESTVQQIYSLLRSVDNVSDIAIDPDSSPVIQECKRLLNCLSMQEVGISTDYFQTQKRMTTRQYSGHCMNIATDKQFEMTIFILPRGSVLLLHDHPDMAVCTKLLQGRIHLRSFSSISRPDIDTDEHEVTAKLEVNILKSSADEAWSLSASQGNFHELAALENCIMVDLIFPPYDEGNLRPCTFYQARELSGTSVNEDNTSNNQYNNSNGLSKTVWLLKPLPANVHIPLPLMVPYKGVIPKEYIQ